MSETESRLVGQKIWLEYYDQNYTFEKAFTPQYCTIRRQLADADDGQDWHLIRLDQQFVYRGPKYEHLLIRSRWVGGEVAAAEPTAVFIILVPDPDGLKDPFKFKLDDPLFISWGFTARRKEDIKS